MSLNGLDGAAVAEALQAAQADAGGWFLLRYVNRDTVEVLSRGTGGVPEVRGVIQKYEEKSPLYGLVQYRRKKVVLKYVPDGTSRLLQVRLTVQFQTVLETFTPHDTVFSFTAASELTESALGLSTMLQPSAASLTSSSSSLRRRRLNEISEDVEEPSYPAPDDKGKEKEKEILDLKLVPSKSDDPFQLSPRSTTGFGRHELDELPASAVLAKALLAKRKEAAAVAAAIITPSITAESPQETTLHPPRKTSLLASSKLSGSPLPSPLPSSVTDKSLPATPDPTPPSTSEGEAPRAPDFEATSNILLETTSAAAAAGSSSPSTPRPHTRHLSAAESDSISQWSSNVASYSTVKPKKKKLGPRPHVEPSGRPKTSGTTDSSTGIRPVANLPTSIRVNNKSLVNLGLRPGSQQSTRSVPGRFATASHSLSGVPPLPSPSYLQAPYSPVDSRSAILRPASVTGDASTATPEKVRLMKALQLRKRNMLLAQRASGVTSSTPDSHAHNASESSISTTASSTRLSSIPSQEQLLNIDEESKLTQSSYTSSPTIMTNISEEPSTKASSFAEQDVALRARRSLSSATSSSLTPKAMTQDNQGPVKTADPAPVRPSSSSSSSLGIVENEPLPQSDIKAALAYLAAAPEVKGEERSRQGEIPSLAQNTQTLAAAQISASPGKSRRLGPPEPLKLRSNSNTSASDLSEDDSLIEDIQNATVHEAMPVSVARSPVTPIMSKGSSDRLREIVTKPSTTSHSTGRRSTATTPDRGRSASGSIRSISTALPQWPPLPTESSVQLPLTKKATLGTGISKRIKALEVLRTKETSPPRLTQPVRETSAGTSAFSAFMKRSSFLTNQQQAPNASTDNSPPRTLPSTGPHYDPHSQPVMKDARPSTDANRSSHKGETISVTARIVRDPNNKHPPLAPSSNYHTPLNLHRSPLIVEHEKHDQSSSQPNLASHPPRVKSPTKSERGRFSFSSHRSASHTNLPRSESNHSAKISKSSNYKRHGPRSASDAGSISEDKTKTSMTSRLMKRMSNLANSRNKNQSGARDESNQAPTNSAQDHHDPARDHSITESLLHVVDIGDVNVQFPESFLWKRRFMRIDDQGFLIFSPPAADGNVKTINRKYHLGDFKRPNLPDLEREEMAWSIILDLKDGRCIQCACESKHSQHQVLQMLVDAHSAYHQLYGA